MARPRVVLWGAVVLALLAGLLSLGVETDTDPENMLRSDHEVRVRNAEMRDTFAAHEMLVVGVVEEEGGIATPELLGAVDELRAEVDAVDGVRTGEIVSFASVGDAAADVDSRAGVQRVVDAVAADPALAGNVLSEDGTTAALFVPLQDKSDANPVASAIDDAIGETGALDDTETYVAGLPLAEEAFGEQMFVQMAVFAPLAGLLIFLLMLWFFRKVSLVLAAMAVALLSVVWTMGALIGSGNSLHIMSSMIPIFLMPIAILDSVHVLSEFFDRYPHHLDRRATLRVVYRELYRPLTYTSVTTGVAFASLAIAPIPPIRTFGLFVAFGVFAAWLLSVAFIPAYVMTMNETRLARAAEDRPESHGRLLNGFVRSIGHATRRRGLVGAAFVLLALVAIPGVARIEVNDNPVNWFKSGSEVRVATEELNQRLPGTFNANLLLVADEPETLLRPETTEALDGLAEMWDSVDVVGASVSYADLVDGSSAAANGAQLDEAASDPLLGTLITEDRTEANVRLQLDDGDNQAMRSVVDATDDHLEANPLPDGVATEWAGETYLNLVWQDEMVSGMFGAFVSTLVVVGLLMVALFRSLRWAMLSLLPVLWTVLVVYGALGLVGKDYDMPIAVLSTLVLGIGVDFAIHFVQRFREYDDEFGDRAAGLRAFFEEPARALTRNALVIAVGFTPLFFSSLVPYLVVGAFLSLIIVLSWLTTLLMLPAIVAGGGATAAEPEPAPRDRAGAPA